MEEWPLPKLPRLEGIENNAKASKLYYHFIYKALIVSIFLVVVPLLSSQALDFVNQNIHSRRRELLQLTFVGIVVSYGLFSKRSEESEQEKENSSTFDNAHSYIARLLPSVFGDEPENASSFDDNNKIQTWNSQYYRGEPMVVIATEDYDHQEQSRTRSFVGEKPLHLPVRSLTSRISDAHLSEPIHTGSSHRPLSGSDWLPHNADESMSALNFQEGMEQAVFKSLGSMKFSSEGKQTRNQGCEGLSTIQNMEEKENAMIRLSPIPWRTRSGRIAFEEDINGSFPQNSEEDFELNKLKSSSLCKSLSSLSSRIDSSPPSPNKEASSPLVTSSRKISPSASLSGEAQEKRIEDFLWKNSFDKSSPAPPPPPLSPTYLHKSSPSGSGSGSGSRHANYQISGKRELKRSVRSVPTEFNENKRVEVPRRGNSWSEFRGTENQHDGSNTRRSVRAIRQRDTFEKTSLNEFRKDFHDEELKKWSKAIEEFFGDKKEFTNKMVHEKLPSESRQTFLGLPIEEEIEEFIENGIIDTEEDSESQSEDDFFDGNISLDDRVGKEVEEAGAGEGSNVDGGPDVDKKADEFITKFREQIRLQRIQSIKRSPTPYPDTHSTR